MRWAALGWLAPVAGIASASLLWGISRSSGAPKRVPLAPMIAPPPTPAAPAPSAADSNGADDTGDCAADDYPGCGAVGVVDVKDALDSEQRAPNFTRCIVTLINKRLALTALHCFNEATVVFTPKCKYPAPGAPGRFKACRATVSVGDQEYAVLRVTQVDKSDAALLVLDRSVDAWLPFDPAIDLWAGSRPVAIGLNISATPADEFIVSRNCTVRQHHYRCDVTPGFSGGPITDRRGAFLAMVTGKHVEDAGVWTSLVEASAVGPSISRLNEIPKQPSVTTSVAGVAAGVSGVRCVHGGSGLAYTSAGDGTISQMIPGSYRCRATNDRGESFPSDVTYAPQGVTLNQAITLFDGTVAVSVVDATVRECASGLLAGLNVSRCACGLAKMTFKTNGAEVGALSLTNPISVAFETTVVDASGATASSLKTKYRDWFVAQGSADVSFAALLSGRLAILARGLGAGETLKCAGADVIAQEYVDATGTGCKRGIVAIVDTGSADAGPDGGSVPVTCEASPL